MGLGADKSCPDSNRNGGLNYLIVYFFTPTYLENNSIWQIFVKGVIKDTNFQFCIFL